MIVYIVREGFPHGSVVKNPPTIQGMRVGVGSLGHGRSSEGENGNPLQYSCLGNPMDRPWWAAVHGVAKQIDLATAAAAAKSLQSCPTLCDPRDSSLPGSPSLGISRQEHWSGLPFPSLMQESEK